MNLFRHKTLEKALNKRGFIVAKSGEFSKKIQGAKASYSNSLYELVGTNIVLKQTGEVVDIRGRG